MTTEGEQINFASEPVPASRSASLHPHPCNPHGLLGCQHHVRFATQPVDEQCVAPLYRLALLPPPPPPPPSFSLINVKLGTFLNVPYVDSCQEVQVTPAMTLVVPAATYWQREHRSCYLRLELCLLAPASGCFSMPHEHPSIDWTPSSVFLRDAYKDASTQI